MPETRYGMASGKLVEAEVDAEMEVEVEKVKGCLAS